MAERTRLTSKTAAELMPVQAATDAPNQPNDVYVNDSRTVGNKNVPSANGTPETWNEGVQPAAVLDKKHNDETNRNEMGLIDAKAAVKNASELESKAVKCLVASQRMLPGAHRDVLEANAFDMMYLPSASIDGILSRQEGLARSIAASASKIAEECKVEEKEAAGFVPFKKEDKVEEKEAAVAAPALEPKKDEEIAKLASQVAALTDLVTKLATVKKAEEVKEEKKEEAVKTASSSDALTDIFAAVTPAANKAGAASMQGLVRTAANREEDLLSALWNEE